MDEVMKQDSWEERAPGSPAAEVVEPGGLSLPWLLPPQQS